MFIGALVLCFLPPADMKPTEEKDEESLTQSLVQKNESVGVIQGMKNCFYLLTTPKFVLLTFTMFANGYYMSIG